MVFLVPEREWPWTFGGCSRLSVSDCVQSSYKTYQGFLDPLLGSSWFAPQIRVVFVISVASVISH